MYVQTQWETVLDLWSSQFESFISAVGDRPLETIDAEEVQQLLNDEELFLLRANGVHFTLPEGVGNAYDLRSQVQGLMWDKQWK